MKEVIPKDSRYLPLTQQKYCCVPASISIIMYKHNIPLLPQELIGYYLGLTVPKKLKKLYWKAPVGKRRPAGYGTRVDKDKNRVNKMFKKFKIPLTMTIRHIKKFDDKSFEEYLKEIEKKKMDVLVCFDHSKLNGKGERQGHVCVVDKVYLKRGEIRLIDPSFSQAKWRYVKIKQLKAAMISHIKTGSAGFWEFKKIK